MNKAKGTSTSPLSPDCKAVLITSEGQCSSAAGWVVAEEGSRALHSRSLFSFLPAPISGPMIVFIKSAHLFAYPVILPFNKISAKDPYVPDVIPGPGDETDSTLLSGREALSILSC